MAAPLVLGRSRARRGALQALYQWQSLQAPQYAGSVFSVCATIRCARVKASW